MPRPILKRTAKSYQVEIERLGRLRTALRLDTELSDSEYQDAVAKIDVLTNALMRFVSAKTVNAA